MIKIIEKQKNNFRLVLFIIFTLLLQVSITYVGLKEILVQEDKDFVRNMINIVKNDMKYSNGKWDTTLYNSNPLTPYPNASSTFPLYVITTDGFVIERSKPINGFLDTSDLKQLLQFNTPQSINTITNEKWRILSNPVMDNGSIIGVIVVSYYNPEDQILESIDKRLYENLEIIERNVYYENNNLIVKNLDIRTIDYSISFEVVNKFNKLVVNNGRLPAFIDPSYVNNELNESNFRNIVDQESKEEFVVANETINDENGNPIGVVVVGKSIEPINTTLKDYLLLTFIVAISLTFPTIMITILFLKWEVTSKNKKDIEGQKLPKFISFNSKTSILIVDTKQIEIPFDTNQHYLLKLLFSSPKKKWEHDEILEKFGESFNNSNTRKIYDTMSAINKKAEMRLIIYQDKKYFIQPDLLSMIQ